MENNLYECEEKFQSDFDKNYNEKIKPFLNIYETKRKNRFKKLQITMFSIVAAVLIDIVLMIFTYKFNFTPQKDIYSALIILFVAFTVSGIIVYTKAVTNFQNELNSACTDTVLNTENGVKRTEKSSLTDGIIKQSEIFEYHDERYDYSSYEGNFLNKELQILHTSLKQIRTYYAKGIRRTSRHEVFKGVIINIKSNKTLNRIIKIAPKGTDKMKIIKKCTSICVIFCAFYILAIVAHILDKNSLSLNVNQYCALILTGCLVFIFAAVLAANYFIGKNKDEKLQFVSNYEIETSDLKEANIPDGFFEYLDKIKTAFNAKKLFCSIFNDNILIKIPVKETNVFQIGSLFYELTKKENIEAFYKKFLSIFLLIMLIKFSNDKNPNLDI